MQSNLSRSGSILRPSLTFCPDAARPALIACSPAEAAAETIEAVRKLLNLEPICGRTDEGGYPAHACPRRGQLSRRLVRRGLAPASCGTRLAQCGRENP